MALYWLSVMHVLLSGFVVVMYGLCVYTVFVMWLLVIGYVLEV